MVAIWSNEKNIKLIAGTVKEQRTPPSPSHAPSAV